MNSSDIHPIARDNHMLGQGNIEKLLQEVEAVK